MKKLFVFLTVSIVAVLVIAQSKFPNIVQAPAFRMTNGPAVIGQIPTATSTAGDMAWSNAPAGGGGVGTNFAFNPNQFVLVQGTNVYIPAAAKVTNLANYGLYDLTIATGGRIMVSEVTPTGQIIESGVDINSLTSTNVLVQSNGVNIGFARTMNFTGATVTSNANVVTVAVTGGSGTPAGANGNVQYNNAGAFGAEAAFTYDSGDDILTVGTILMQTATIYQTANIATLIVSNALTVGTGNGSVAFGTNFIQIGAVSSNTSYEITPTNAISGVMVAAPVVAGVTNQRVNVPLTAGQTIGHNGTTYVAVEAGNFSTNTDGTAIFHTMVQAGIATKAATNGALFWAKPLITNHAVYSFLDTAVISHVAGGVIGHASFDAAPTIQGTVSSDHHHAYQDASLWTNSGTLTEYAGISINPRATAGTVTKMMGLEYIQPTDAWDGATIGGQFGVYIKPLTKGGTNWAVWTDGTTPSRFGGAVRIDGQITAAGGALVVTNATGIDGGGGDVTTAQLNTSSNEVVRLGSNNVRVAAGPGISVASAGSGGVQTFTVTATNPPVLMTQTNFVLDQVYSNNTSSPMLVNASAWLMSASVDGNTTVDLMYSTVGGTNYSVLARTGLKTSLAGTLVPPVTNSLSGVVTNLGSFYFTASVNGAGNSAGLVAGSGQSTTLQGTPPVVLPEAQSTNFFRYVATTNVVSLTVNSIPQGYNRLRFHVFGRSTNLVSQDLWLFRVNDDASTHYYREVVVASGAGATLTASFSTTVTGGVIGTATASNSLPSMASLSTTLIPEYSNPYFGKVAHSDYSFLQNTNGTVTVNKAINTTFVDVQAPITNLTIYNTQAFSTGTVFHVTLER